MRVTIHQPEFAPWLGFFHKVRLADKLVLLDDVQFRKNYFQNRNRLLSPQGMVWITVPVRRTGLQTRINQVEIAENDPRWRQRILKTIQQNYRQARYFESVFDAVEELLRRTGQYLVSINIPLIRWMLAEFGLIPEIITSSALGVEIAGSQRILEICQAVGATAYISGISGRDYLDLDSFARAGIAVEFQQFYHPIYPQLQPGFVPQVSALEALLLLGPESKRLLQAGWPEKMDTLFE